MIQMIIWKKINLVSPENKNGTYISPLGMSVIVAEVLDPRGETLI